MGGMERHTRDRVPRCHTCGRARAAPLRSRSRGCAVRHRRHARTDRSSCRRRSCARGDAHAADRDLQALPACRLRQRAARRHRPTDRLDREHRLYRQPRRRAASPRAPRVQRSTPTWRSGLSACARSPSAPTRPRFSARACATRTRKRSPPSTGAAPPTSSTPRRSCGTSRGVPRRRASQCTGVARCSRCVRPWRSTRGSASPRCCRAPPIATSARRFRRAVCRRRQHRPRRVPRVARAREAGTLGARVVRGGRLGGDAARAGRAGRPDHRRAERRARAARGPPLTGRALRRLPQGYRPAQRRRRHRARDRHGARRRAVHRCDDHADLARLVGARRGDRAAPRAPRRGQPADRPPARRGQGEHRPARLPAGRDAAEPAVAAAAVLHPRRRTRLPRPADPRHRRGLRDRARPLRGAARTRPSPRSRSATGCASTCCAPPRCADRAGAHPGLQDLPPERVNGATT